VAERVAVVGLVGGEVFGKAAHVALESADVLVGAPRHLDHFTGRRSIVLRDLASTLDAIAASEGRVCVLASGDPGFFGIVRALGDRLGPERLEVHPAPSSVALAFARLGLPWDDAVVVSAHGRPVEEAVAAIGTATKAAVLTAPTAPPEAVGRLLAGEVLAGGGWRVAVCSALGEATEDVEVTDVEGLAHGTWDPLSVVILWRNGGVGAAPSLAWGRSEAEFAHRAGMITKAEVRAVVLGKLALPRHGVMWDVGAGSGSVAIEAAGLAPGLRIVAVERNSDDAARIGDNALRHGVCVEVVEGEAPDALADLPDPDRAFVGGGGLAVLDAVLERLRPGGRVVAAYAAMDRAADAWRQLGHLVEISVGRGEALAGGVRLAAENPVFVVWGPEA
jgi:precorrin-6Y C5,15-methyltransferase (decarboxylating)